MLALRKRFSYRLAAAHLNHGIRGAESDHDEAFVRELCARCEIDLTVDTDDLYRCRSRERARDARQAFFNAAADRIDADYIALAHHADDQAETVMMRLLRAGNRPYCAGVSAGVKPGIIAAVLVITRAEVITYLGSVSKEL